jgi:hypothetical protein
MSYYHEFLEAEMQKRAEQLLEKEKIIVEQIYKLGVQQAKISELADTITKLEEHIENTHYEHGREE